MRWPETVALMDCFGGAGIEARFAGGCVRDALLSRTVKDVDLATSATPERVVRALEASGIKVLKIGIAHGTVTAVLRPRQFEITTLRVDVETDGRWAKVAFTDNWQTDAERRDFTMNALFMDAAGRVIDFVGGLADLEAGRVRFVGDPAARIEEDYLRILRFFRFHADYGRGAMDASGLAAAAAAVAGIAQLSGERVRQELLRLLSAADPVTVLTKMADVGVLDAISEGLDGRDRLAGLLRVAPEAAAILRLSALLVDDSAARIAAAERFKLSNAERQRILDVLAPDLPDNATLVRRSVYRHGNQATADRLRLAWAETPEDTRFAALTRLADQWQAPAFVLKGRHLRDLGEPPGPRFGALLRSVETWWIDGDFQADEAACLKKLKSLL
jgi:poly(A) polymerase